MAVLESWSKVLTCEVVIDIDEYSHSGVAKRSLMVISNSWKYGTRNLLCTSLMIDQNSSERARERHSRKIEYAVSSTPRFMFMSLLLRDCASCWL